MKGTGEKIGRVGRERRGGIAGRGEVSVSAEKKLMELFHNAAATQTEKRRTFESCMANKMYSLCINLSHKLLIVH